MFGYILPEKPEMKIKDYEVFRAFYCGICKSIGKRSGQLSRMVLNYDFTFLAVLLSSILTDKPKFYSERCIAHPINKKLIAKESKIIDYAADMNVILAYHKLKDDWNDERSYPAVAGSLALTRAFNKIKKKHKVKSEAIEYRLKELSNLEREKCSSIDMVAEPFAKLMEELAVCDSINLSENDKRVLAWIGYNIGKWIYIIDAFNDIEQDMKKDAYNPFILAMPKGATAEEIKANFKDSIDFVLTYTISEISKAYELLDKKNYQAITENIIYLGMLRKTENILGKGSCNKIEKSI